MLLRRCNVVLQSLSIFFEISRVLKLLHRNNGSIDDVPDNLLFPMYKVAKFDSNSRHERYRLFFFHFLQNNYSIIKLT
jgi:hypothetical protein